MSDLTVAKTILTQLGGNRFTVMTGAKNFLGGENFLAFQIPARSACKGINKVKITLDPSDTYTVDFLAINYRLKAQTTVASHSGIYCDDLERVFSKETGLATRL